MSDVVIKVDRLSKLYRIGLKEQLPETLMGAALSWLKSPLSNYRALRSLSDFSDAERDQRTEVRDQSTVHSPQSSPSDLLWALKDVSFEVKRGEVLGVIGRNGAGKSTLLKILSGITEPTSGQATIHGRVASLLEVGTGFHPDLTGRENIYLNGTILGMTRKEIAAKFDEIVDFSGIERFIDTPVKRYSSGMYVRLAFSVAAHLEPEILLVDEVLAVGDAEFQKKCLGKMGEVAKGGRTVLFVSHNMAAVEQLCSACLLLDGGRVGKYSTDVRSEVKGYLSAAQGGAGDAEWIAPDAMPQNDCFVARRLAACGSDGKVVQMPIRNDAETHIRIEGEVLRADPALCVGFALFTESGDLLFWSYNTDSSPAPTAPATGHREFVVRFPSRLLNEGVYRLELIAGLHYREWFYKPGNNSPGILVSIRGGMSDSPYWMVRRPGILAPVLEWSVK